MIFFATLAFCNFFAVDADVDGRVDADANLRSFYRHDGYFNVVTYS